MLLPCRVLLGLETEEAKSKPLSLLYEPAMFWDRAISFARSIDSSHSWAEVFEGSPVVTEDLESSNM